MKIAKFLSDRNRVENWLLQEKISLDRKGIYLSYWFHEKGFGLVIVDRNSGEFHSMKDGTVTMHVEKSVKEILLSSTSSATDERTMFQLYESFKDKVCNESA